MSFAFVAVVLYLIIVSAVGIYFGKFIKNDEDFAVAGRSLPAIVLAGTLMATWMGSGTVVGGTNSLGYKFGPWVSLIFSVATPTGIAVLYFLSKKVRDLNLNTVPEVFEIHYGKFARVLSTLIILCAYLGITAYQYKGVGFVLNSTIGISTETGTLISFVVIMATAVVGGLYSVAYTDFMSAAMMLIGLCIGVPLAIKGAGGWSFVASHVPPENLGLGGLTLFQALGYFFPLFFYILGDQNMYQRFFAAKDGNEAKKGAIGWFVSAIIVIPLIALAATTSRALYPDINAGQAFIHLAVHGMPTVVGGLCVAAVAAFVITTGNSFLLSSGINLSLDIYCRFFNPDASHKQRLFASRLGVVSLGIIAYVLIRFFPTVLSLQMYAYTMYGAAITPALIGAIVWKRSTKAGGITSMLVGAGFTMAWEMMGKPAGVASVMIAAPLAIVALIVVSLAGTSTARIAEVQE